jgi:dimethylargininase
MTLEGATGLFDFTNAIVRTPGASVISGLRDGGGPDPDFAAILAEHAAYVSALQSLGVSVDILPSSEAFPDSIFVEDPALVFTQGAIILNLAAPSRAGETTLIEPDLNHHFKRVLRMNGPGHADGGDVLVLRDRVVIGLSGRTDRQGAEELVGLIGELGHHAVIAETPKGVLHFKTGCSLIDEETVLAVPVLADRPEFGGMRVVLTPEGERPAANLLRIGKKVLIGAAFTKTQALIESLGIETVPLKVSEIGKIDAGLSCMSLRWRA